MAASNAKEKFTGKSAVYEKSRPGYPAACYTYLMETAGLTTGSRVADVGAGTGLFSRGLLERGLTVYAVEPNEDMRREAERLLSEVPDWHSFSGTAEHTGLPGQCVELVTAAQAFHWFDPDVFREECRRILKPAGFTALVWNHRDAESPLVRENAAVCREYCPDFHGFSGGADHSQPRYADFFRGGLYETRRFSNDLFYTLEGFVGRNLSSSYAPRPGDGNYRPFIDAVTALFRRYEQNGRLRQPNVTVCHIGQV